MATQIEPQSSTSTMTAVDPEDYTNQLTAAYFAAAILGLLVLFTGSHIVDLVLRNYQGEPHGPVTKRVVLASRKARSMLLRKVPGFTSLGHAVVFIIYLAINLALIFHSVDLTGPSHLGKRMGWVTACNIALVTFLALKNTPLAFLTAHSYERLNVLHQAAGYCTVVDVILHALLQIVSEEQRGNLALFLERAQIMGIVAGLGLVTTFTSAVFLKPIRYEAFYIIHIVMFMLILISIGMHRPNLSDKTIFIIIVAASIWGSDRLLRASRLMIMAVGNRATIAPLGQGGVRISMHRPLWRATPGSHVFLWIPRIRPFEAHPFTLVSTNPLELVVSAQDGFTRDLLSYATANPGATLRASYDGPYGTLPNFSKFDQVVLIAGGSGASFTFGVALHLVRQAPTSGRYSKINFMWVIREHEYKQWFAKELSELGSSPYVTITVYITRSAPSTCTTAVNSNRDNREITVSQSPSLFKADPEKTISVLSRPSSISESNIPVVFGRPDISAIVRDLVASTGAHERTIVAACGPNSLMAETRGVVAGLVASESRIVTLHCEQFGW